MFLEIRFRPMCTMSGLPAPKFEKKKASFGVEGKKWRPKKRSLSIFTQAFAFLHRAGRDAQARLGGAP